jgi:hypothetical protein
MYAKRELKGRWKDEKGFRLHKFEMLTTHIVKMSSYAVEFRYCARTTSGHFVICYLTVTV